MNYIGQINSFFDRLPSRPLSVHAVAMWCLLHHLANRAGWPRGGLAVREDTLRGVLGIGHGTFCRARSELAAAGLIAVLHDAGNRPPRYVLADLTQQAQQAQKVAVINKDIHSQNLCDMLQSNF